MVGASAASVVRRKRNLNYDDLHEFTNEEYAELDRFAEWLRNCPEMMEWAERVRREMDERARGKFDGKR